MGDAPPGPGLTRANGRRTAGRRRAVGTRDRIIDHLAAIVEIADPAGMASTRLAQAVGYPGSSVAFAQLLSGMERDGLIKREVRGKRTYRIMLVSGAAAGAGARAGAAKRQAAAIGAAVGLADAARAGTAGAGAASAASGATATPQQVFPAGIDYDELARRLLIRVIRGMNGAPAEHEETLAVVMAENTRLRAQVSELRRALDEAGQATSLTSSAPELT